MAAGLRAGAGEGEQGVFLEGKRKKTVSLTRKERREAGVVYLLYRFTFWARRLVRRGGRGLCRAGAV